VTDEITPNSSRNYFVCTATPGPDGVTPVASVRGHSVFNVPRTKGS
jgi:hypothetical protein